MTATTANDVTWDPYDVDIKDSPSGTYRRLREEAPLYRNEEHDFWALSRFDDVQAGLLDHETYSSAKGAILELIKADMEIPPGVLIFEDPPLHTVHRSLLARVFTPKRMNELEPQVRAYCARALDPLVGSGGFDLVKDFAAVMPMRVIGMLLGIPDEDQEAVRDRSVAELRTEPGKPMRYSQEQFVTGEAFEDYIDWRADHPSDDLMTELLHAEFEDEQGVTRTLTREEVLTYTSVVAGAGNDTTTLLIGWMGKVLADHPDQRREIVEDRDLIPAAIEELLRYEPPAPHLARSMTRDMEYHGQTVPAGSIMMMLIGAANRDDRRYPDGDRFDIHRPPGGQHLTFGYGVHFCLGAALARLEGRVALDELLTRFPQWEVDTDRARLAPTSTLRGWETLPIVVS